uniref:Globin domain-containing protein n=1 Tax=Amphora coffeiformis TaxID=265554 RepID=A0A7S3PE26_9STRA|mmetsp:Transcript_24349/g.46351  ORF Transcript_24349/g.46351 Transcript_24349/m.46351 type:complete len:154 (+) Transcript_24349:70-531(+)|eukprot:scaffold1562_cov170-Amphora_coffeaeformis.AAC.3
MREVSFNVVGKVLESWDASRANTKNFETILGTHIAQKLLELAPEAGEFFGDQDPSETLPYHRIKHFEMIVQLLDTILQLMGPDFETIGEILEQLGMRHKRMGVDPDFFPYMGHSIVFGLRETMGKAFTMEHEEAWLELYGTISDEIVAGIKSS